ncbi:esterase/lipase family protein [Ferrovibrio sp.]|uniref:esterase/lipase family protein n=1 Tax=Ferrovibrio sp. TaxID=1917215 RepID=UPI0035ADB414
MHGLARNPASLARLETACKAAGYHTLNWGYPSRDDSIAGLLARFRGLCDTLAKQPAVTHFIGHSLGGLLLRAGLIDPVGFPLGRLVTIASPHRGSGIVARLRETPLAPLLPVVMGKPVYELAPDAPWLQTLGWPAMQIGAIGGTRRFHPLTPASWFNALMGNSAEHDGTVELTSALPQDVNGAIADYLRLDAGHSFMADDPRCIAAALNFVKTGRFA